LCGGSSLGGHCVGMGGGVKLALCRRASEARAQTCQLPAKMTRRGARREGALVREWAQRPAAGMYMYVPRLGANHIWARRLGELSPPTPQMVVWNGVGESVGACWCQ